MKVTRRVAIVVATFVALSLFVATFSLAAAEDIDRPNGQRQGSFRARFKLTKLKDFTQFKEIYHKVYQSVTENAHRAKLYLKRALNVFKNNIRYLKRRTSKFLKINPTSDWTEKERESIFSALTPSATRRKRSAAIVAAGEQTTPRNRRRFGRRRSMSRRLRLFKGRKSHRSRKNGRGAPNSNRPSRTNEIHLRLDSAKQPPSKSSADSWPLGRSVDADGNDDRAGDDRVLLDYRDTGCLFEPKSQKKCGACYIFSATALFEYQHCRQTGKLVAFSEQYAIDCGRRASLRGCDGGLEAWAVNFFARYGMETARKYPFRAADQTCPYGRASRHEIMGRVRANGARLEAIDYAQLGGPDELQALLETRGPLTISVYKLHDFADYGGGVDLVSSCSKSGGHAMVLIGHGREDGLDYWLIRNSHGGEWGLGGHYKLAKRSNPECIMRIGYLDGVPKFELNKANNEVKTLLKRSSKMTKNPPTGAL